VKPGTAAADRRTWRRTHSSRVCRRISTRRTSSPQPCGHSTSSCSARPSCTKRFLRSSYGHCCEFRYEGTGTGTSGSMPVAPKSAMSSDRSRCPSAAAASTGASAER